MNSHRKIIEITFHFPELQQHVKSDNIEIRIGDDINDVIKELFKSLLKRYQANLQEKMRGSEFGFDGVNLLYYDFNKIRLNRGASYIEPAK